MYPTLVLPPLNSHFNVPQHRGEPARGEQGLPESTQLDVVEKRIPSSSDSNNGGDVFVGAVSSAGASMLLSDAFGTEDVFATRTLFIGPNRRRSIRRIGLF